MFGALANKYFMFFDNKMAESITSTGQFIIQDVSRVVSAHTAKIVGVNKDYNTYSDTDSLVISYGDMVAKHMSSVTDEQKITDIMDEFIKKRVNPVLDECTDGISARMNFLKNTISFKRESISSAAVFTGKKRYMQRVLDNEDVRYAEPDYKITGIETNRSSTPDIVRGWLVEAIKIILDTYDLDQLVEFVETKRKMFTSLSPEQIAFPRSANNLAKYNDPVTIYTKGMATPIAVRASLLYNSQVAKYNLTEKYDLIREGDKIKYLYLIEPNILRENVVAFISEMPREFGLHKYVDYTKQFEKVFLDPLTKIADALAWNLAGDTSLDDFFG